MLVSFWHLGRVGQQHGAKRLTVCLGQDRRFGVEASDLVQFLVIGEQNSCLALPIPERLPAQTPPSDQPRFEESSVYPYLETNVHDLPMQFSQEPIPDERTASSIATHGPKTPFRHWHVMRRYVKGLLDRNGYGDLVSYNTTVEKVEKLGNEWKVTLRKQGARSDYWWAESFDAVVVASGHYWVPYIPAIEGLEAFEKLRPGSVLHSKHFRGRDDFRGTVWPGPYFESRVANSC